MKEEDIQELVDAKLLQEKAGVNWRCALGNAWNFETHPKETIAWARFVERGFEVSTSDFFRGILEYYGLQLVHLNPNGILHILIFVHLCEAYLGIHANFNLFWKIFRCKLQSSQENMSILGGASFQMREKYSNLYLEYETLQSHGVWKEKWFYVENHKPQLPAITGYRPKYITRWLDEPTTEEIIQFGDLLKKITVLKKGGLTGINGAASFLKRRIQPLKLCPTWGFEYASF